MHLAYTLTQAEAQKNVQAVLHALWPAVACPYHKIRPTRPAAVQGVLNG